LNERRKRERPWTLGELTRHGARRFRAAPLVFGHGTTDAQSEAAVLALDALGLPPEPPAGVFERPVSPRDATRILALFEERIRTRRPAPYLTGVAWLGETCFHVDERVIVPRSHIAALLAARLAPWVRSPGRIRRALDLCTGSGCLAILTAHSFPRARIDATDLSRDALAVAGRNVRAHRLGRRIRLLRSDLFSALAGNRYDLIVCNPPYVSSAAMRRLPREYRHEPSIALAGGSDGLDIVRRLVLEASAYLAPGGWLVAEVGTGRRRLERAFPRTAFVWPEIGDGDPVFVINRGGLPD
jgi:ribosomal protein L3 glutamine methyltransferase